MSVWKTTTIKRGLGSTTRASDGITPSCGVETLVAASAVVGIHVTDSTSARVPLILTRKSSGPRSVIAYPASSTTRTSVRIRVTSTVVPNGVGFCASDFIDAIASTIIRTALRAMKRESMLVLRDHQAPVRESLLRSASRTSTARRSWVSSLAERSSNGGWATFSSATCPNARPVNREGPRR